MKKTFLMATMLCCLVLSNSFGQWNTVTEPIQTLNGLPNSINQTALQQFSDYKTATCNTSSIFYSAAICSSCSASGGVPGYFNISGCPTIQIPANPQSFSYSSNAVGIGTSTPDLTTKLHVNGKIKISDGTQGAGKVLTSDANGVASWAAITSSQWSTQGNNIFFNTTNGSVLIGTTTADPKAKLNVNGNARIFGTLVAREILVNLTSNLPDYVFESDYKLKSLQEIEEYVKINKHLPEVPSAKEVADNGMNMGEFNATLLKKVEELTLYVIKQQKEIESLKAQVQK